MKRMVTRFVKNAETCGICFGCIEIQGELSGCKHPFCHECILKWSEVRTNQIKNRCPTCKSKFSRITRRCKRVEYRKKKAPRTVRVQDPECASEDLSEILNSTQALLSTNLPSLLSL